MGATVIFLILVVVPLFFFMFTWTVVTACRLLFPEKPLPYDRETFTVQQRPVMDRSYVRLGVREIREAHRAYLANQPPAEYEYYYGDSEGLPAGWFDDLWHRRN